MMGYSSTHVFSKKEQSLLGMARILVESIPEIHGLRCHELVRAVGLVLGLSHTDGKYGMVEHSWLMIPLDKRSRLPGILDIYSVGSLPPVQLVYASAVVPRGSDYKSGPDRDDIDEGLVMDLVGIMHKRLL